jgi:hypothetical protein
MTGPFAPRPQRRGKTGTVTWEDMTVFRRPGLVTLAWRWRAEIALVVSGTLVWLGLSNLLGAIATFVIVAAALSLLVALPGTRERLVRRAWCVITRHRLYAAFRELRATTRMGRLPLVMRVRPTGDGELATLWCRAGVAAQDLEAQLDRLRAACWAAEVRITQHDRWTHVVYLDVVRRQPAAAGGTPGVPWIPRQRNASPAETERPDWNEDVW